MSFYSAKTFNEHVLRLRLMFQRIKEGGPKLRPDKCQFLKTQVSFLGQVLVYQAGRSLESL